MTLDYFYGQSGELFSYFRIPKALFQDSRFRQLSTDARTLYGILLDRMSLSVKNGWMDKQGRVYIIYTVREVQESLCCAEHKAVKLFRELEDIDLIERKQRGLGRPSLIYVKDFTTGLSEMHHLNCASSNSGESRNQVQRFISLANLVPELLDMVDEKKISFNPAVELSYLDEKQQRDFLEAMDDTQNAPSLSRAQRIKKTCTAGCVQFRCRLRHYERGKEK